jgi:hypothetical protein
VVKCVVAPQEIILNNLITYVHISGLNVAMCPSIERAQ